MKRRLVAAAGAGLLVAFAPAAQAGNIIEDWAKVKAPAAPALKPATVDSKTDALLVIDMVKQTCNAQARPRCIETVPAVQKLLKDARAKGVTVVYSLGPTGNVSDILGELTPKNSEPIVKSGPDKFVNTELEKMLKDKGISGVIVVGTLANGGVMHTATAAGLRGLKVVVPVDGSAQSRYALSRAIWAWHLANGPVFAARVTLTKMDMIKF